MADSEPPGSLFIVVLRDNFPSPWFCSILEFRSEKNFFKTKKENKPKIRMKGFSDLINRTLPSSGNHLLQKEYIAHFRLVQRPADIAWRFSPLPSTQELCMVPYVVSIYTQINHHLPSLHAFTFNFSTKTCRKISPCTIPSKPKRCVVSLGGYMYFMPRLYDFRYLPEERSFERYNLAANSWETLQPFPLPRDDNDIESLRNVSGTAVLDDIHTILFNMGDIWAYNVGNNSWYPVTVEDNLCYSFVGEAVVQENTIYAFKDKSFESVLALSIIVGEESNGGDLVYTCSLLSEISLPDINLFLFTDVAYSTRHLVRLGTHNFCVVRSFSLEGLTDHQPIQVTYMKRLAGTNSLIVTDNKVHRLRIEGLKQFSVSFCFSMPDCKTSPAVKHGNNMFFDIDPFREGFDINQIYQKHDDIYFDSETGQFVIPPLPTCPLVARDEVAGSSALSKASTISSATDSASPTPQTVGAELEYYTRGMSRGDAFRARSTLLDRWRKEHCREMSRSSAKNSPFP